jgi:hypothetical protein
MNLATILVRPRRTMRRILDAPRDRMVLPLAFLAIVSGYFSDRDVPGRFVQGEIGPGMTAMVFAILLLNVLLLLALFWFYSWVPLFVGRFLGGTAEIRQVRSAVAWGLVPLVWALLYRIPIAFWMRNGEAALQIKGRQVSVNPGLLADGCGAALFVAMLELIVFLWTLTVASNTLAEAHNISTARGLGTLVLSAIVPLVVMIAAVLAIA